MPDDPRFKDCLYNDKQYTSVEPTLQLKTSEEIIEVTYMNCNGEKFLLKL